MSSPVQSQPLQIRLLGELQVVQAGQRLALPPSKKTRALLGYLLLTQRSQRRDRLCELFWDVADDPRAALRWSLSKLRELLDTPGRTRLRADREQVSIDASDVFVDALSLREQLADGPERAASSALQAALPLFRGELLEGLELPEFHGYYAYCVVERSVYRELHRRVLNALLSRSEVAGQRLSLLRALVQLDPLDSQCRAQLFELLQQTGRAHEAEDETRVSQRLFAEPKRRPEPEAPSGRDPVLSDADLSVEAGRVGFVGREHELKRLGELLADPRMDLRCALIEGDPGIGKSRLLEEALLREQARGSRVRRVVVPEGGVGFPYAPFRELLQALSAGAQDAVHQAALQALGASSLGSLDAESGREQLFRAVASSLAACAAERRLVLALEDVQWMDAASLSLLQYLTSALRGAQVSVLLTGRRGELDDQATVRRVLRALKREGVLLELSLGPLSPAETARLVAAVGSTRDPAEVLAESAGHPLFALELARHPQPSARALPASLIDLIRDRLSALPPEPTDLLRWAAALGRSFDSDTLGRLLTYTPEQLVESLEHLERHGFLQLPAGDRGVCFFAHDLVRHAVYDQLSEPRRRLMHARIARLLMESGELGDERAAHVAHHASLGGDDALATRACLAAGRRCLRLFAPAEALSLARRGLGYAAGLEQEDERTRLSLELLEIAFVAARPAPSDLSQLLVGLTARALDLGALRHARLGFFLQSLLMWEDGRAGDAQRFTHEAERIARTGDLKERVLGLSDAARCLVILERDLPEAEAFLLEAEALAAKSALELPVAALLARGVLQLHRGEYAMARQKLEAGCQRARAEGDRLIEFYLLETLVDLQLQQGAYAAAEALSQALCELGERLRQGSELPLAQSLLALSRYALDARESSQELSLAIERLALADAKQRSALVLSRAAQCQLVRNELALAQSQAEQALRLARLIGKPSETHEAHALLALTARATGDHATFDRHCAALRDAPQLSAHARSLVLRVKSLAAERAPKKTKGARDGTRVRRAKTE